MSLEGKREERFGKKKKKEQVEEINDIESGKAFEGSFFFIIQNPHHLGILKNCNGEGF